jgi:hypothetical protein
VSGFGSTRRLVVYDTLLENAPPAQVRLVVAHELGHAAEDDVLHGTLIGALAAAFGVVLLRLLIGVRVADPRRIALLLALIAAATTLSAPAQNLISRRIESRADYHSLQLTQDPATFVAMQRRLSVTKPVRSGTQPLALPDVRQPSDPAAADRDGSRLGTAARRRRTAAGPAVTGRVLVRQQRFSAAAGGIETFVRSLCDQLATDRPAARAAGPVADRLPGDRLVVLTATMPGDRAYDAGLAFPVERDRTSMLLPTPRSPARPST